MPAVPVTELRAGTAHLYLSVVQDTLAWWEPLTGLLTKDVRQAGGGRAQLSAARMSLIKTPLAFIMWWSKSDLALSKSVGWSSAHSPSRKTWFNLVVMALS